MVLLELLVSWGRIGVLGFGGGPAMIPLIKAECVEGRGWLTDAEFLDLLASSSVLPGPITAKMSVFVGWKVAGGTGALASILGVMGPPAVLMLALGFLLAQYKAHPAVKGALAAVRPAVVGMLAWTVWSLFPDGVTGWSSAIIALVALGALLMRVPPVAVMGVALVFGALFLR